MDIIKERYEISLRYRLIKEVPSGWSFTEKCIRNYDLNTYKRYLRGELEKPLRITKEFNNGPKDGIGPRGYTGPTGDKRQAPQEELKTKPVQQLINDILAM